MRGEPRQTVRARKDLELVWSQEKAANTGKSEPGSSYILPRGIANPVLGPSQMGKQWSWSADTEDREKGGAYILPEPLPQTIHQLLGTSEPLVQGPHNSKIYVGQIQHRN